MIKRGNDGEYITDEAGPCPFCGYPGQFPIYWRYNAWVECPRCHACGPQSIRGSQNPVKDALDYWNESWRSEA